jgi:asparagine synthase (glutamine-hydrolysing)
MCGIFGEFGSPQSSSNTEIYTRLLDVLEHRGPDDCGLERGADWMLGFRRLAILDLSPAGHQPMGTSGGRHWLVFNGEIYNYLELRRNLEQEGVAFRSGSDTEVLLQLLVRYGAAALPRLNGMFAFAFIDLTKRTFLLARDRLGVKPLYWYNQKGKLRFASELKGLLAWPDATRTINRNAVLEFLSLGYIPASSCILEGYGKLEAGTYAMGSLDRPTINSTHYWSLDIAPDANLGPLSEDKLSELYELLSDAVRIRLRSDVRVGLFLSGGIDSGLVASLAADSNVPPLALTVGFAEEAFDETSIAQETAAHLGLKHQVLRQRAANIDDIDKISWTFDEPFGDVSALPSMLLCSAASQHATVFLSGDGGDEAFGGYRRYLEAARYRWTSGVPSAVKSLGYAVSRAMPLHSSLRHRLIKATLPSDQFAAVFDGQGLTRDPALHSILPPDLLAQSRDVLDSVRVTWEGRSKLDPFSRQRALDYQLYLPDDVLVKVDRASMASSIEVRSPFLDYRVVEWAAKLPPTALANSREGKLPLRQLAQRRLPTRTAHARKSGFGVPIGTWMRQAQWRAVIKDRLVNSASSECGLWNPDGVSRLLDLHNRGNRDLSEYLWRLLVLDAWKRQHLDGYNYQHRFKNSTHQPNASRISAQA